MRGSRLETAVAFGDAPDRDVEAEFGAASAKVQTPKVSASVKVQAPKLSVVAPPKPAPAKPQAPVKVPTVKVPTVKAPTAKVVVPPTASSKAKVVTTAKPTTSAASKPVATTAQRGNFLEAGSAPLAAPAVKVAAGTVTMTQAQRDANARALVAAKGQALAARNAPYQAARAADQKLEAATHARLLATDPNYAAREKLIHSAGLDTAQITMGAKVIAVGAAVIASGGAVAGAVGVTTGGAALASAAAADRLVAAVEKGGELGKKASSVISDVKAAAAKGDAVAKTALGAIEAVAKERIAAAIPNGVEQVLTGAAKDAANAVAGVAASLSGAGSLNLGALSASLSAASGRPPAGGGYVSALSGAKRPSVSSRAPASQLSQFDLGPSEPRWLVTPEGRVVDLVRTPAKAGGRGYLVSTDGEVSKQ